MMSNGEVSGVNLSVQKMDFREISLLAEQFVLHYYTIMHKCPELLHRFYGEDSTVIYESTPICGQVPIYDAFSDLKFKNTRVLIHNIDALKANGNSVLIQICGEISVCGANIRRFMRSFTLCEKTHSDFYVLNDIFRYQDRVYIPEVTDANPAATAAVDANEHVPSPEPFIREVSSNGVAKEQSWSKPQHEQPAQPYRQQQPTHQQHQKHQPKRHEPVQAPPPEQQPCVERAHLPVEHQALPPREPSLELDSEPRMEEFPEQRTGHSAAHEPSVILTEEPPTKRVPMSWAQRASSNAHSAPSMPAVSHPKPQIERAARPANQQHQQQTSSQRGGGGRMPRGGGRQHPGDMHRDSNYERSEQPRFQQPGGRGGPGGGGARGGGQTRGGGSRGGGGASRGAYAPTAGAAAGGANGGPTKRK